MKLITAKLAADVPPLYSQEGVPDPLVSAKFFCPWGAATWFIVEFSPVAPDGHPNLAFGWVTGMGGDEAGYVDLAELEQIRGPGGLTIKRDLYWEPVPLSQVKAMAR